MKGLRRKNCKIIQNCLECQICNHRLTNNPRLKGYFYPENFKDLVSSEIVEPYTENLNLGCGKKLIVVTRLIYVQGIRKYKIYKQITSKSIFLTFQKMWINTYENPKKLLTDHSKIYTSITSVKKFLK
ncbi:hypothetical protein DMUE_2553 [Dictyocoela muelleri]|nr:hypothetical protein DMUE_2553 [Dictyocoela muelleri]